MYDLTASEGATILSVLSRGPRLESSEVELHGLPASTFYAARRKIYSAGWLTDRFVPNPWAVGAEAVDILVASPGLSDGGQLERELVASPATVVLWAGVNALFAVRFRRKGDTSPVAVRASVSVKPDVGSIPVFFDYSRSWSRFIDTDRETGYPRSLGSATPPSDRAARGALSEMLASDGTGNGENPAGHPWHSAGAVTRAQRRLLDADSVQSRTILNVDRVPPFDDRALGEVVFITGELRTATTPGTLLGTLHNDCKISPVLFAADRERVVIIALGQLESGATRRTKIARASAHVAGVLHTALRNAETMVERSDGVRIEVNHRYDRLMNDERSG